MGTQPNPLANEVGFCFVLFFNDRRDPNVFVKREKLWQRGTAGSAGSPGHRQHPVQGESQGESLAAKTTPWPDTPSAGHLTGSADVYRALPKPTVLGQNQLALLSAELSQAVGARKEREGPGNLEGNRPQSSL